MKQKAAILCIVAAGLFWGTSGLFVSFFSAFGLSSLQITSVRAVTAGIAMAIFLLIYNRKLFKVSFKEVLLFLCSGSAIYLTAAAYFSAIRASSVSIAVVLMYTSPVMVMLFSVLFMKEKFSALKGVSVAVMIAGCALVSGITEGFNLSPLGFLLGMASAVMYSAYNIFTKLQMKRGINPFTASTYSFIFMGVFSLFGANPPDLAAKLSAAPEKLIPMGILLGIVTCVMPYLLYTISLSSLEVSTAATLSVIEPLAATIFSVMFIEGEELSIPAAIGILLIVSAVVLLSREGTSAKGKMKACGSLEEKI